MLGAILLITAFCNLDLFLSPTHFKFTHRGAKYYFAFAEACEEIRQNYPLGTNEYLNIKGTDSSIPKIIQDLPPRNVQINKSGVWIAPQKERFAISWSREGTHEGIGNRWVLIVEGEGSRNLVFTTNR